MPKKAAKSGAAKSTDDRPVIAVIFLCGLFAAAYGLYALITESAEVVTTSGGGAQEMTPLISIPMIAAGVSGIGFSIWAWLTRGPKA